MDTNIRKIPVFVFPTLLKFFVNARHTHKQLLTLYNPIIILNQHNDVLVLSTAPNKYAVIDPEGSIGPTSCVDIVIRHTFPMSGNCNIVDKFRVIMQDHSTKQVLGKRDIEAKLLSGEPDNISTDDNFHTFPQVDRIDEHKAVEYSLRDTRLRQNNQTQNYIAIISGIVCILALLLPTNQEVQPESKIPSYLHLSINLKLVFAYVLGLVSMVVFKP